MNSDNERTTSQATLLVVDDVAENLDVLAANLRELYQIKIAQNGESAVKLAAKHQPDLILMDVEMPVMDGFEACRRIQAHSETAGIPVIFVTALGSVRDEKTGFAVGGVDYITKPISPPILRARVKTHLELREARRHIQSLLTQTLSGAVSVMTEVLGMASPVALGRAARMRQLIREMSKKIDRSDKWQFDLAAMLSQLGCVSMSPSVLKKIHYGVRDGVEDQAHYDAYPELSAKLVARIPRLEEVARMIETQLHPPSAPFHDDVNTRPAVVLGAQLLHLATSYDTLQLCGANIRNIIHHFAADQQHHDPALVTLLIDAVSENKSESHKLFDDLRVGARL
ncbi:MAG: response regulator [Magnetococcales bacterium]|nr:response regulator [Magnetococcales bacterium]